RANRALAAVEVLARWCARAWSRPRERIRVLPRSRSAARHRDAERVDGRRGPRRLRPSSARAYRQPIGDIPMRVSDLMTPKPITVGRETPMLEARQRMLEERIRHLVVVDDARVVGIVTDRDIRLNLPSPATSLSVWEINFLLARLTVGAVMTSSVIVI